MANTNWKFETKQLHAGQESADPVTDSRAVPIYATTSYVFHDSQHAADRFALKDAGNIYGRLTNPTQDIFEQRIAALEGGTAALGLASGAAAINYTILALAKGGEHIVASKTIYGGTYNLLAHTLQLYGISATFVDPDDFEAIEAAIQDNTKALYIETLGNPNSNVADIEKIADIAHKHGLPLVADSTFATPYLVRPFEYGADIVVHSATKFIGGHGTAVGGVVIDCGSFDWAASGKYPWISEPNPSYHGVSFSEAAGPAAFVTYIRAILLRDTGATLSPFHAFIFLQGLETLSLRVERHVQNALKIVEYLSNHPQVEAVHHPSLASEPSHELYNKYFPNGGGGHPRPGPDVPQFPPGQAEVSGSVSGRLPHPRQPGAAGHPRLPAGGLCRGDRRPVPPGGGAGGRHPQGPVRRGGLGAWHVRLCLISEQAQKRGTVN